jgi:DNA-binding response OmpR family regulator
MHKKNAHFPAWQRRHALCDSTVDMDVFATTNAMATHKKAVILIVEDDRDMRSLLCDEFCSAGYQLREAEDGHEAFLAVLQSVPDVILTDLRMPAGGADYISRLRTVAPCCPIVVMTAYGDARSETEVLQAGATTYFAKPVRISELKTRIEELLTDRT